MTISFPLTFPTDISAEVSFAAIPIVGSTRSPFTQDPEVFVHQGQVWVVMIQPPPFNRADAEDKLISFLLSLNGMEGTFTMGDPTGATARGALGGTPLVAGASQTGQDLNIDGCSNDITGWLKKGDYIQLGSGSTARLYKSLVDSNTNGSGETTLTLWPAITLNNSPANNATVTTASCVGLFRLASNKMPWDLAPTPILTGQAFTAISEP